MMPVDLPQHILDFLSQDITLDDADDFISVIEQVSKVSKLETITVDTQVKQAREILFSMRASIICNFES